MSLTIDELKEKIKMVEKDITSLQANGDSTKKIETLSEYHSYLKDQLIELTNSK